MTSRHREELSPDEVVRLRAILLDACESEPEPRQADLRERFLRYRERVEAREKTRKK